MGCHLLQLELRSRLHIGGAESATGMCVLYSSSTAVSTEQRATARDRGSPFSPQPFLCLVSPLARSFLIHYLLDTSSVEPQFLLPTYATHLDGQSSSPGLEASGARRLVERTVERLVESCVYLPQSQLDVEVIVWVGICYSWSSALVCIQQGRISRRHVCPIFVVNLSCCFNKATRSRTFLNRFSISFLP